MVIGGVLEVANFNAGLLITGGNGVGLCFRCAGL